MAAKRIAEQTGSLQQGNLQQGNLQYFETDFTRLGEIVARLEEGNIPLDEMLKLYEEGMKLSGRLSSTLQEAELRVQTLAKAHEEMQETELQGDAEATDADIEDFLLEE